MSKTDVDMQPIQPATKEEGMSRSSLLQQQEQMGPQESIEVDSAHFSLQGRRQTMEDRTMMLAHPKFNQECKLRSEAPRHYFAVFDGHGGHVCAEYCRRHLHKNFTSDKAFPGDVVEAMKNGVLKTDANFTNAARNLNLQTSSGTCAIIVYIEGRKLYVANVGDSRAIMCRNGKAMDLSSDHKPSRPDEKKRIEVSGGAVARSQEEAFANKGVCSKLVNCCCRCVPAMPLRVYPGGLSVSRAIGDIGLKQTNLIIPNPEITEFTVTPADQFIIMACDGVWDVLSSQDAVSVVKKVLDSRKTVEEACEALCNKAFSRGSTDNISASIITLKLV